MLFKTQWKRCIFLLASTLLLSSNLWAKGKDIFHFKPLTTTINFPTNEVRKLYQDSEGYIWISTYNGLLRYDGYSIVMYKPDGVNRWMNYCQVLTRFYLKSLFLRW